MIRVSLYIRLLIYILLSINLITQYNECEQLFGFKATQGSCEGYPPLSDFMLALLKGELS